MTYNWDLYWKHKSEHSFEECVDYLENLLEKAVPAPKFKVGDTVIPIKDHEREYLPDGYTVHDILWNQEDYANLGSGWIYYNENLRVSEAKHYDDMYPAYGFNEVYLERITTENQ